MQAKVLNFDERLLCLDYLKDMPIAEIMKKYDVVSATMFRILDRNGVKRMREYKRMEKAA